MSDDLRDAREAVRALMKTSAAAEPALADLLASSPAYRAWYERLQAELERTAAILDLLQ